MKSALLALALISGCAASQDAPKTSVTINRDGTISTQVVKPAPLPMVSIKDIPNDAPQFKREYRAQLPNGRKILVTIHTFMGDPMKNGELTQADGKYVLFDPDAVADKILDPQLVPIVEKLCRQIDITDRQWRGSKPAEYVDENGTRWRRQ